MQARNKPVATTHLHGFAVTEQLLQRDPPIQRRTSTGPPPTMSPCHARSRTTGAMVRARAAARTSRSHPTSTPQS